MSDSMLDFLQHLSLWHWLAVALFYFVLELLTGTGFLLWTGIAATIVSIVNYFVPHISWQLEWIIFSGFTVFSAFAWWFYLQRKPIETDRPKLNRRAEQYIGRTFHLIEPIMDGRGKMNIDDTTWKIKCREDLPAGTKVKITSVNSVELFVEKE